MTYVMRGHDGMFACVLDSPWLEEVLVAIVSFEHLQAASKGLFQI